MYISHESPEQTRERLLRVLARADATPARLREL